MFFMFFRVFSKIFEYKWSLQRWKTNILIKSFSFFFELKSEIKLNCIHSDLKTRGQNFYVSIVNPGIKGVSRVLRSPELKTLELWILRINAWSPLFINLIDNLIFNLSEAGNGEILNFARHILREFSLMESGRNFQMRIKQK